MKRICSVVVLFALMQSVVVVAQVAYQQQVTQRSPIEIMFSNCGTLAFDAQSARGHSFWPRGSNQQFIFGAGLWIGGLVPVGPEEVLRKAVFVTWDPNSGKSWATPLSELTTVHVEDFEVISSRFTDTVLSAYANSAPPPDGRLPLGLEFKQDLLVRESGPYQDVAVLSTVITNIHPTRTIENVVVDLVVDADIGPRDNLLLASQEDYSRHVPLDWGLDLLIASTSPHNGIPYGHMGVVLVNTPDGRSAATMRNQPIWLDPLASEDRYNLITSGVKEDGSDTGDIRLHIASHLYTLAPGEKLTFRYLIMFSNDEIDVAQAWMASVAEYHFANVSVDESDLAIPMSLYPNPAYRDGTVRVETGSIKDRVDIIDEVGRTIRTFTGDVDTLQLTGLPSGIYHVRVCHREGWSSLPLVIVQ